MKEKSDTVFYLDSLLMHEGGKNLQTNARGHVGQRTSVTTTGEAYAAAPADRVWMYDALGQVVSANEDRYAYDRIGNRTSTQKGTEQALNYEANALNQYVSIDSTALTYDADGNQLTGLRPVAALPERNQLTFTYNAQNRPIQVKQGGIVRENYTYDHQGRRIQKGDTLTLYDGYNAIAEYNLNTRTLKTTYAWGMDISGTLQNAGGVGGLLSVTDHTTQIPVISYPTYDGNGNITEYLTEENRGLMLAHYEYDAFGNVAWKTGNKEFAYQFSTKPYDSFTGINYYNYRNYDPCEGRWINRDLVEEIGGISLYVFVYNDGINKYDYLGNLFPAAPALYAAAKWVAATAVGVAIGMAFDSGECLDGEEDTKKFKVGCSNLCRPNNVGDVFSCYDKRGKGDATALYKCKKRMIGRNRMEFVKWIEKPSNCDAGSCDEKCCYSLGIEWDM